MSSVLKAVNISIQFGGLKALDNFNLDVQQNQLQGLIGPNGAGKTTAFNLLTGVYQPTSGDILLEGQSILKNAPFQRCRKGMTRTFQNIRLFRQLTVLDNILIACSSEAQYNLIDAIAQSAKFLRQEKALREKAYELLKIFHLQDRAESEAGMLPYGEQRKLEIVRALATRPKVVLLDEPAAGMNHSEKEALMHTIARIRQEFKVAVLLIEHDMKLVMGICEHITVLDHGQIIATGNPKEIQRNPKVIEAYLGSAEIAHA